MDNKKPKDGHCGMKRARLNKMNKLKEANKTPDAHSYKNALGINNKSY